MDSDFRNDPAANVPDCACSWNSMLIVRSCDLLCSGLTTKSAQVAGMLTKESSTWPINGRGASSKSEGYLDLLNGFHLLTRIDPVGSYDAPFGGVMFKRDTEQILPATESCCRFKMFTENMSLASGRLSADMRDLFVGDISPSAA